MFTSDVCWSSLGTSIFGNLSSVSKNTRSKPPSRLSLRFLWLCNDWPNFIALLPLFIEILDNICICEPGCDIINFEINLIFLIKPSFYITRKSTRDFKVIKRALFIIFKGLSVTKSSFTLEGAQLKSLSLRILHFKV